MQLLPAPPNAGAGTGGGACPEWGGLGAWGEGRATKAQSTALGRRGHILTTCTHSMRGSRTDWFPDRLTTQAGVSGVASSSAITASMPILLLRMRSKAEGVPPRCTWPRTVTRVSKPSLCTTSCPSGESKAVLAFAARPYCPASPQAPSPGPHPPRPAAGIWGVSSQGPTEPAQGVRSWHVSV